MGLSKARIYTLVKNFERDSFIEVMFNPENYAISSSRSIDQSTKTKNKNEQITGSPSSTLTFDLFYDTYSSNSIINDVSVFTTNIYNLMKGNNRCEFVWGSFTFSGFITNLTEEYTQFSPEGTPVRATLKVTMTECGKRYGLLPLQKKFDNLLSLNTVDILTHLAISEGKSADKWREMANKIGISNPRI